MCCRALTMHATSSRTLSSLPGCGWCRFSSGRQAAPWPKQFHDRTPHAHSTAPQSNSGTFPMPAARSLLLPPSAGAAAPHGKSSLKPMTSHPVKSHLPKSSDSQLQSIQLVMREVHCHFSHSTRRLPRPPHMQQEAARVVTAISVAAVAAAAVAAAEVAAVAVAIDADVAHVGLLRGWPHQKKLGSPSRRPWLWAIQKSQGRRNL